MTETKIKPEQGLSTSRYFVGSLTRSQTAVDADVAYTGVGFKPKSIQFNMTPGTADGTYYGSWGFDDGTNHMCILWRTAVFAPITTASIFTGNGSGQMVGVIKTFDPDGFTITWSKAGSALAAANMTIVYMAFR